MEIGPRSPTVKGPPDRFTGEVFVDAIAQAHGDSPATIAFVHFTPGARTAWHSHSLGQTLYVTEGEGRIQSRGRTRHDAAAPGGVRPRRRMALARGGARSPDDPSCRARVKPDGGSRHRRGVPGRMTGADRKGDPRARSDRGIEVRPLPPRHFCRVPALRQPAEARARALPLRRLRVARLLLRLTPR